MRKTQRDYLVGQNQLHQPFKQIETMINQF